MESVECAVIGTGAVGLAVARALSMSGREVVVIEATDAIGTGISSRNSEVIHAGIYYPENSAKARLCLAGRDKLYQYLDERHINYQRCAKLIVATESQDQKLLRELFELGLKNGVSDLEWLDGPAAQKMEPALRCQAAVLSPSTGIFDSHAFLLSLQGDAEKHGCSFAFLSPVTGGQAEESRIVLEIGGKNPSRLSCQNVINAAGLGAQALAAAIDGIDKASIPSLHKAKGNYFFLSGKAPFSRLVYPLPGSAGLGIHYTKDLSGQARFGPDVEWVDDISYAVDESRAELFRQAIRSYWPEVEKRDLQPGYAGIRPKVHGPSENSADFIIQDQKSHAVKGLINLYAIESPGLTACLAIADHVVELLD
jgi:L-2-hydroxyglutarate oxidase LhgO